MRCAVTLSVAFGCPFEGEVDPSPVAEIAERVAEVEPDTIVLADTIGVATPSAVRSLTERVVELGCPTGGHFHNTRNTGYANALAALEAGASVLDASIGGLGGCPFAPRATGQHRHRGPRLPRSSAKGWAPASTSTASSRRASGSPRLLGRSLEGQLYRAGTFPPRTS